MGCQERRTSHKCGLLPSGQTLFSFVFSKAYPVCTHSRELDDQLYPIIPMDISQPA